MRMATPCIDGYSCYGARTIGPARNGTRKAWPDERQNGIKMATSQNMTPTWKEEIMYRVQRFQTAAREGGFVVVKGSAEGSVLWLRKSKLDDGRETHQRMCVDRLTNSATVYWMDVPGKVISKTFRGVVALQEWLKSEPETCRATMTLGTRARDSKRSAKVSLSPRTLTVLKAR